MPVSSPRAIHENVKAQLFIQLKFIKRQIRIKCRGIVYYKESSDILRIWFSSDTIYQAWNKNVFLENAGKDYVVLMQTKEMFSFSWEKDLDQI